MPLPIIRTMVVDDDTSWQQILSEILTDLGSMVDIANNLEEAIHFLKSQPHKLAVVDLSLMHEDHNNNDGLCVLDAVRRLDPGCQTILLTGFATVELAVSALTEYGVLSFLRKETFHRGQFRDLLSKALATPPIIEDNLTSGEEPPANTREESGEKAGTHITKVLIVDDDAGWRSILEELAEDTGYKVCISTGLGDALGYLHREYFSLAVVDLSFGRGKNLQNENLDGFNLLEKTKSLRIPTIVVSGVASVNEIQRAYAEYSVFAFLEKQIFDRNVFCHLIEEVSKSDLQESEINCLTKREHEVFDLMAIGKTNKEIAGVLGITTNTVKRHLKMIFKKLDVHTRSAATAKATGGKI